MEIVSIRELRRRVTEAAQRFEIHAQVSSLVSKLSRGGKPFYELNLADAEDSLKVRLWDDSELFKQATGLSTGAFVSFGGEWVRNDPFGIEPRGGSLSPLPEEQKAALLEGSTELRTKQATDYAEIEQMVAAIQDPRLRGLCQSYLDQFGDRFRRTAAARNYHHARRGGLVEHMAQMMRSAKAVCSVYTELNEDLILAGVLFHDCGKLWENAYAENDFTMPYTEIGELLSHIPMGMEVVNKLWRDLLETPEAESWTSLQPPSDQVRLHLLHLIGSHHGEHAFGAPVLPKTPEAAALHYIDNLDAKLEMFAEGYQKAAPITRNIFERVRPLPGNLVRPLAKFDDDADA
tara:strand:+ start:271 stop:1311 length:1041 start_codon:yes stop_codon:yes gene_type:complete